MAIFRKIHTSFWSDTFIQELDNEHKLFYLYLLTNEKTKQCGIYEISKKQISFDLGYSIDRVTKILAYFIKNNKIMYSESTKELAIRNWNKFNSSSSPKVVSCTKSELNNIKNKVLIEYVYSIYTPSQEEQEEEEEQEKEKEEKKEPIFLSEIEISESTDEKIKMTVEFWKLFKQNLLDLKVPNSTIKNAKSEPWINQMRLIIEVDKREIEDLRKIYIFLKNEKVKENGFAWKKNILSISKLREKFETLLIQANNGTGSNNHNKFDLGEAKRNGGWGFDKL